MLIAGGDQPNEDGEDCGEGHEAAVRCSQRHHTQHAGHRRVARN